MSLIGPQTGSAIYLAGVCLVASLSGFTVLGFAPCRVGQAEDYVWINITDKAAYAPRDGAGAVVFKDRMWLIGGWNPRDKEHFPRICNNEVWSSQDGANWTLEKSIIDAGSGTAALAVPLLEPHSLCVRVTTAGQNSMPAGK